jgi:hypothetical protein
MRKAAEFPDRPGQGRGLPDMIILADVTTVHVGRRQAAAESAWEGQAGGEGQHA